MSETLEKKTLEERIAALQAEFDSMLADFQEKQKEFSKYAGETEMKLQQIKGAQMELEKLIAK